MVLLVILGLVCVGWTSYELGRMAAAPPNEARAQGLRARDSRGRPMRIEVVD